LADVPARHKLCVGVECNPRPAITAALHFLFRRAILTFGKDETPNLVTLDALAFQIAKCLVLVFGTGAAKIAEKFQNRCAMHANHSGNGTKRITLDQSSHDCLSFIRSQLIHD
jgi:hypothetical protein